MTDNRFVTQDDMKEVERRLMERINAQAGRSDGLAARMNNERERVDERIGLLRQDLSTERRYVTNHDKLIENIGNRVVGVENTLDKAAEKMDAAFADIRANRNRVANLEAKVDANAKVQGEFFSHYDHWLNEVEDWVEEVGGIGSQSVLGRIVFVDEPLPAHEAGSDGPARSSEEWSDAEVEKWNISARWVAAHLTPRGPVDCEKPTDECNAPKVVSYLSPEDEEAIQIGLSQYVSKEAAQKALQEYFGAGRKVAVDGEGGVAIKDYDEHLSAVVDDNKDLMSKNAHLCNTIERLTLQRDDLQKQYEETKAELDRVRKSGFELQDAAAEVERIRANQAEAARDLNWQNYTKVCADLKERTHERDRAIEAHAEANKMVTDRNVQIEELKETIRDQRAKLDETRTGLESELKAARNERDALAGAKDALGDDNVKLHEELRNERIRADGLQQRLDKAEAYIESGVNYD